MKMIIATPATILTILLMLSGNVNAQTPSRLPLLQSRATRAVHSFFSSMESRISKLRRLRA